jgi:hypothetical protein
MIGGERTVRAGSSSGVERQKPGDGHDRSEVRLLSHHGNLGRIPNKNGDDNGTGVPAEASAD